MIKRFYLILFFIFSVQVVSFSQYCTNGGPSNTEDSNVESISIFGESSTSIQYTGCPGVIGIQDLTNLSVLLDAGASYSLSVQFGTCGGDYAGAGEVWIDFNNDLVFDQTESIGVWTGTPPTSISNFNFTVPLSSQNATTRMRITQEEGGSTPLDPCANFSWGSVMDFTVNIQNGVDCSGFEGNYPSTAIEIQSMPFTDTKSTSYCYFSASSVYASPDIFYKYKVNPASNMIKASLCGSNFDTYLSIQDTGFHALFYNDDSDSCAPSSEITFATEGLDSIYFVVEGYGNDTGTFILNVEEIIINSIQNENLVSNVEIYPNPASSIISFVGLNIIEIKIYDINFKQVLSKINNFKNIDISGLSKGIHFIEIINSEEVQFKKIVIE